MTTLLDEEELIKTRPLLFEQRPYNRLVKRCSTLVNPSTIPSTPTSVATFTEELELDFKSFETTILRTQHLLVTNRREVLRYESEKLSITETACAARTTLVALREALADAQQEKANKLVYDAIAGDILSRPGLKSREEQAGGLERLKGEIAELEREREEYREVWAARRDQFGTIVEQLERMWGQIKEDKDEQDRREGMSEEEEGEEIEASAITRSVSNGSHTPFTPPTSTPFPAITPASPDNEKEEGEEDEEREEGEHVEEGEDGGDIDLVDARPDKSQSHHSTEEEEGEVDADGDKMDMS